MLVACFTAQLALLKSAFFFHTASTFLSFQSGKKTVKAVLWVSADGLRVVDDKTKVRKDTLRACHLCLLVQSSPLSCLPPHQSVGNKDKEAVYSLQHAGVSSVLSSFSPAARKDFAGQNKISPHIHLCRAFCLCIFPRFPPSNQQKSHSVPV